MTAIPFLGDLTF